MDWPMVGVSIVITHSTFAARATAGSSRFASAAVDTIAARAPLSSITWR